MNLKGLPVTNLWQYWKRIKKVNIIYGLNGTGKSTLSNFLYNPDSADYEQCSVDQTDDETILVYNQQFIHDQFYVADKLKGIFSLSKENKDIEVKVNTAERELQTLETKAEGALKSIEEEEAKRSSLENTTQDTLFEIKHTYAGGDRVLEYCLIGRKKKVPLFDHMLALPRPDTEPLKTIQQIKSDVEAISDDTAQQHPLLPTLSFSEKDIEENEIFKQVIVGNTDSPISALITKLSNSDWVRDGLDYLPEIEDDAQIDCPFCQEKTITKRLAEHIENYFDETYEESINSLSDSLTRYQQSASSLLTLQSYKESALTEKHLSQLSSAHAELDKAITSNIRALETKIKTPSGQLSLVSTADLVESFNDVIGLINTDIGNHNERLKNVKGERESLKDEFWSLMRWQYDQTIAAYAAQSQKIEISIVEAKAVHKVAISAVQEKRDAIAELQKSTVNIEAAITNINNGLRAIGMTDFTIKRHDEKFYRIIRSGDSDATFSSLSEGEKMIISFLYFCEVCKGKRSPTETPNKKIAVIDDPVSSLSHIYVYNIGRLIKYDFFESETFDQVIVLTHSLYFFYELTDTNHQRRKKTQNLFRLTKNSGGTSVRAMKYEEVQNDYHSYWSIVIDENQNPALIANCMRNIVEYFFNFVQRAELSNVMQKPELQDNRFQAFGRYINRESHSLGQNIFDFKEFDYEDFKEGLRLVFKVTGYEEHYAKMTSSISI